MIAMEINLTITMTYLQLKKKKNYALQKPFETDFLTVISNAKLRLSFAIIFNIFFLCKIICTNYFIVKFIEMYSLKFIELSGSFIKNENSFLPILIKKNFKQKIYFCLLKIRSIFFKEGKSNFFDFFFYNFEKRRLAQGIRRPKAANCRLMSE